MNTYKRKNAVRLRGIILDGVHGKINIKTAADMLKIGRPALSNLLNGKSELSIELAKKIEYIFRYKGLSLLQWQLTDKYKEE